MYENVLKKTEAHYLALGHHADDQVETMLMALTKVTRPEVLSGIPISRFFNGSEIIRPLLSVNKIAIETYCEKHRIHPRDRKSTRLNSSHVAISYAVFCLKNKKTR